MGIPIDQFERMKARTQQALIKAEPKEAELHAKIRDYCKAQWPRWKYIECRMDKRSTIATGANDFTIFMPHGGVLCVECKRKGQKLDKDQMSWAKEMEILNHRVFLVHSMDEFVLATKEYLY